MAHEFHFRVAPHNPRMLSYCSSAHEVLAPDSLVRGSLIAHGAGLGTPLPNYHCCNAQRTSSQENQPWTAGQSYVGSFGSYPGEETLGLCETPQPNMVMLRAHCLATE